MVAKPEVCCKGHKTSKAVLRHKLVGHYHHVIYVSEEELNLILL